MRGQQAAAQALHDGDAIAALQAVALNDDPVSLAIRGAAMARIGDLDRARRLLKEAARGFSASDRLSAARCVLALAEVQLAQRDGGWPTVALNAARAAFLEHGDTWNIAYLKLVEARRAILLNCIEDAEHLLAAEPSGRRPSLLTAVEELLRAHVFLRTLRVIEARAALARSYQALPSNGFEALRSELVRTDALLEEPVAKRRLDGRMVPVTREALRALNLANVLIVDGTLLQIRHREDAVSLVSRPVLFSILKELAAAWPHAATRADLIRTAFGGRQVDESHRIRLRMEIMRLRRTLGDLCRVVATPKGFRLEPHGDSEIVALEPVVETRHMRIAALLADGEAWTSLAVAEATGSSRRSVQRALEDLRHEGLVEAQGAGPSHRWRVVRADPITTPMLLSR